VYTIAYFNGNLTSVVILNNNALIIQVV